MEILFSLKHVFYCVCCCFYFLFDSETWHFGHKSMIHNFWLKRCKLSMMNRLMIRHKVWCHVVEKPVLLWIFGVNQTILNIYNNLSFLDINNIRVFDWQVEFPMKTCNIGINHVWPKFKVFGEKLMFSLWK